MALIACEDCGREVSTKASACPHCGCPVPPQPTVQAPPPAQPIYRPAPVGPVRPPAKSSRTPVIIVLTLVVAAWAGLLMMSKSRNAKPDPAPAAPAAALSDAAAAAPAAPTPAVPAEPVEPPPSPSPWRYDASQEGMSDKPVRSAIVTSTNSIELGFPYAGPQNGILQLRRHPRWGNDVIFSIERGQILCHSFGECRVGVRFDDGEVMRVEGTPPSDNSSEVVFLPMYSTFMKRLKTAKRVRVEVQLYQNGAQVFDFDVSGFDPEALTKG